MTLNTECSHLRQYYIENPPTQILYLWKERMLWSEMRLLDLSDLEFLDEFFSKTPEFSRFNSTSVRLGQFSGSFPLVVITRDKKIFIIRCINPYMTCFIICMYHASHNKLFFLRIWIHIEFPAFWTLLI